MLTNQEKKTHPRTGFLSGAVKRQNLSLNLHTMPQTITSHWRKWLILGFIILGIFALTSCLLYAFTQ